MLYLLVLVGFLFFAGLAMTINEGLWNNTVLLLCLMISGIMGVVAGGPVGILLLDQIGQGDDYAWYCLFVAVWGVFTVSLLVLRIVADKASQTRVRFLPLVDKIGGMLMGLLVAVMLSSFAAYTLLKVPVAADIWKLSDASVSVQDNFKYAATPFNSALRAFTKAEGIDASL
jgi:hypothetical protein